MKKRGHHEIFMNSEPQYDFFIIFQECGITMPGCDSLGIHYTGYTVLPLILKIDLRERN